MERNLCHVKYKYMSYDGSTHTMEWKRIRALSVNSAINSSKSSNNLNSQTETIRQIKDLWYIYYDDCSTDVCAFRLRLRICLLFLSVSFSFFLCDIPCMECVAREFIVVTPNTLKQRKHNNASLWYQKLDCWLALFSPTNLSQFSQLQLIKTPWLVNLLIRVCSSFIRSTHSSAHFAQIHKCDTSSRL